MTDGANVESSGAALQQSSFDSNHRRVLATLDHEAASSSDEGASEEFEDPQLADDQFDEDNQSFVGISIGREQDRLKAPQTPAADKAAALDGEDPFDAALRERGYGDADNVDDESPDGDDSPTEQSVRFETQQEDHLAQEQPSGPPRPMQGVDGAMSSVYRDDRTRPRAYSGPTSSAQSRKIMNINLPNMSKFTGSNRFSLPSIDTALAWVRGSTDSHNVILRDRRHTVDTRIGPLPPEYQKRTSFDGSRNADASANTRDPSTSPQMLRRSTSDGSLALWRTTSRASSLGDDSRWEEIHAQVNSRVKALKDSWADANYLRLPRFKTPWFENSKSDLNLAAPKTQARDFGFSSGSTGAADPAPILKTQDTLASPPGGMTKQSVVTHPQFSKALKRLTGDIVILGGYRGSILRSAEPPNRQLWVPIKVGLNLRKVNLEVGLEPEDEERMEESIFPSGMLKNIGPVDISKRLFKRLRSCKNAVNGSLRVWDYGYDWRLSPHLLSRQLETFLQGLPSNQPGVPPDQRGATVVCHSLGGLITRHVVNKSPSLFSGVLYAGVPQTCVNILGPLRNGDAVLLSSKVLTAQVNFTIRTSYALLPLDGQCFIDAETKETYPVDFFDPQTWEEYRLTPCIARPLPPLEKPPELMSMVSRLSGSMASVLPSVAVRKNSIVKRLSNANLQPKNRTVDDKDPEDAEAAAKHAAPLQTHDPSPPAGPVGAQMGGRPNPQEVGQSEETTISTAVTIPKDAAARYLARTLAETKQFKLELAYRPELQDAYPPAAVIYGKSTPTVSGAKVRGREGIKHADAYDNLQFASGDGVVLARAAQIPDGYHVAKGGVVSSDRGHVTLLGDLEAVGRCLNAIILERRRRADKARAS